MNGEIRDNLKRVLETMLEAFLDLAGCDAGSVFTVRKGPDGRALLSFEVMITRRIGLCGVPEELRDLRFAIDDSTVVGRTGLQRRPIRMNAADPMSGEPSSSDVTRVLNYDVRSLLSGPLITPRGDLVGVVQLLNKLSGEPATARFGDDDERLFSAVAGQSALAIENSLLLDEQERLLEGFVNACVVAIEARDPVTAGHSLRVAGYSVRLAEAVNRTAAGPLGEVACSAEQLRELRFASMLHDVGKIGVPEQVLRKQKKLLPHELELVRVRLKLIRAQLRKLQKSGRRNCRRELQRIGRAWTDIMAANEPSVVKRQTRELIADLPSIAVSVDGEIFRALTENEADLLSIPRGTLSDAERLQIESHVSKTFEILRMIPWSRGLERVPEIAGRHHEKLDGSGYPRGVRAGEIPVQARIMAISDIYDALTAADRPYKPAVPAARALDILRSAVTGGKLDPDCFNLFLEALIFEAPDHGVPLVDTLPEFVPPSFVPLTGTDPHVLDHIWTM